MRYSGLLWVVCGTSCAAMIEASSEDTLEWSDHTECTASPGFHDHMGYYSEMLQYEATTPCSNGVSWIALSSISYMDHNAGRACQFRYQALMLDDRGELFVLPAGDEQRPGFLQDTCTKIARNVEFYDNCHSHCEYCSFNPLTFGSHDVREDPHFESTNVVFVDYSTGRYLDVTMRDGELCRYQAIKHSYDDALNIFRDSGYEADIRRYEGTFDKAYVSHYYSVGMFMRNGWHISDYLEPEEYQAYEKEAKRFKEEDFDIELLKSTGKRARENYYAEQCPPGSCCLLNVRVLSFDDE